MYDDEINDDDDDDDDRYLYHLFYCCNNKVNSYMNKIKKVEHLMFATVGIRIVVF